MLKRHQKTKKKPKDVKSNNCIISTKSSFIFILRCVVLIRYTEDNLDQRNAINAKDRPIELLNLT